MCMFQNNVTFFAAVDFPLAGTTAEELRWNITLTPEEAEVDQALGKGSGHGSLKPMNKESRDRLAKSVELLLNEQKDGHKYSLDGPPTGIKTETEDGTKFQVVVRLKRDGENEQVSLIRMYTCV